MSSTMEDVQRDMQALDPNGAGLESQLQHLTSHVTLSKLLMLCPHFLIFRARISNLWGGGGSRDKIFCTANKTQVVATNYFVTC